MTNSLNSVLLEGNLVRDPFLHTVGEDKSVCNFTLATNRYWKKNNEVQTEVSYLDVEVWGNLAENCGKYLHKGRGVRVSGRLRQDRWNTEEGDMASRVKIVGEHVEFKFPSERGKNGKESGKEKVAKEGASNSA